MSGEERAGAVNRPPCGESAPMMGEDVGQTWQTQRYCKGLQSLLSGASPPTSRRTLTMSHGSQESTVSEWTLFRASIVEVADQCFGCKVPVLQAISKPAGGQVMDTFKLKESNQILDGWMDRQMDFFYFYVIYLNFAMWNNVS